MTRRILGAYGRCVSWDRPKSYDWKYYEPVACPHSSVSRKYEGMWTRWAYYWNGPGGVLMFPMLVTVCVAGTASMFLQVSEPMGVNPIAELGPARSDLSDEGIEKPSPA